MSIYYTHVIIEGSMSYSVVNGTAWVQTQAVWFLSSHFDYYPILGSMDKNSIVVENEKNAL